MALYHSFEHVWSHLDVGAEPSLELFGLFHWDPRRQGAILQVSCKTSSSVRSLDWYDDMIMMLLGFQSTILSTYYHHETTKLTEALDTSRDLFVTDLTYDLLTAWCTRCSHWRLRGCAAEPEAGCNKVTCCALPLRERLNHGWTLKPLNFYLFKTWASKSQALFEVSWLLTLALKPLAVFGHTWVINIISCIHNVYIYIYMCICISLPLSLCMCVCRSI